MLNVRRLRSTEYYKFIAPCNPEPRKSELESMHIIVCIKQVPDTRQVRLDEKTHTLIREGVESVINPFDMYALEEGLRSEGPVWREGNGLLHGPPSSRDLFAGGPLLRG